jgi:hypothetical protein
MQKERLGSGRLRFKEVKEAIEDRGGHHRIAEHRAFGAETSQQPLLTTTQRA